MTEISLAFAKVNLSLDIISRMADGYHNMKMVMQSVNLFDEINVECVPGKGISINAGAPYLPDNGNNIAVKAARAFFECTGIFGYRVHIRIVKNIPVGAGLGGGSADGACVLRVLDSMFDTNLGRKTLESLGSSVGSDVPFCIVGGTSLVEGRGEILTDLPPLPGCCLVICKPAYSCFTKELFSRVRCEKIRARPDTDGIVASLVSGDLSGVARRMYNVFEDILPYGTREIADIKSVLLNNGAIGAVMTGSGSAVFGIFDSETHAQKAYEYLKASYNECYICQPKGRLSQYCS